MVLWSMHPWERDARLVKEALKKGQNAYGVLVEVACTRSSEELLGARKAYHSLFDYSIEEDVASRVHGIERKVSYTCTILSEKLFYDLDSPAHYASIVYSLTQSLCDMYEKFVISS